MSHWNIQINIQRVEDRKPEGPLDRGGDRKAIDVLKLAVTADTEQEAYAKAHRMLTANEPERVTAMADVPLCQSEHGVGHSTCPKCWGS